jgi:hypothetical protein
MSKSDARVSAARVSVTVRIKEDIYKELTSIAHTFFPFPVRISDVLRVLPRSPCCGALLLQLTKGGELICSKCRKRYTLSAGGEA